MTDEEKEVLQRFTEELYLKLNKIEKAISDLKDSLEITRERKNAISNKRAHEIKKHER